MHIICPKSTMTIKLGKRHTPVSVSVYFVGMVVLCLSLNMAEKIGLGLFFAALHELGHLVAMLSFGARPNRVCFAAAGVRIECPPGLGLSFGKEVVIAFAGPAVSIFLALLCYAVGWKSAALINLGFALFNLLPVRQLDGGRAVYYAMCRHLHEPTAANISFAISLVLLFVMATGVGYISLSRGIDWPLVVAVLYVAGNC